MKRLSYNYVKESFEKEGYQLLSLDYRNNSQKLDFICPKGHRYSISWNHWNQGGRCKICLGSSRTLDYLDIKKSFEKEGYQLLTTEYKNSCQRLEFLCPNNHKHSISWDNWKQGHKCGVCSSQHLNIKDVKESFEKEGYQLLTTGYKNSSQKLDFICSKGHKHFISWAHWQRGHRCNICVGQILTYDDIKRSFEKEGYQLLTSEYKNCYQKLDFMCPKGHNYYIMWNSWQQGCRCGICSNNKALDYANIKESFERENYQLLSFEYKNSSQKLDFICPKGHKHSITWNSWQRGQRCGLCSPTKHLEYVDIKKSFEKEGYRLLTTEYVNVFQKLEFICLRGHKHFIKWREWQQGCRCKVCSSYISKAEKEVFEFLDSKVRCIPNNKTTIYPYELDIVIPSKRIAIEYCGLYWHSELSGKDRNYHLNKLNLCQEKGYSLITIFEDEYLNRKDVVLNRLLHILNINDSKTIYARDCKIKEIDNKLSSDFLNLYHIQGNTGSGIKLGAFYNNKLISIMTFSKLSIAKGSKSVEGVWELSRFCSHINYRIVGVASKLFSYFEKNYNWNKIISYADRRWSNGNMYYKLGFDFVKYTQPNYWYLKNGGIHRIHRFSLRKKPNEPKEITEWEIRQEQGYNRIWDCGNMKFIKVRELLPVEI
jgi:hypothetical protein